MDSTTINFAPPSQFQNLTTLTPDKIISSLIGFIMVIAGVAFFFMLVWGGIRWIISGGDKGQTEAARNQITAALVGLVIVFAAWAILSLVGSLFHVNLLSLNLNVQ